MISGGINLVMTVIGFAVSTMFIVFVCTRLIWARIQLTASRRAFAAASRADLSILERGLHGVEPLVLSKFPTRKCSDTFFSSMEDAQCIVCLAEYQQDDILRILPDCGHSFHTTCIDRWLQQHCTCPVCRISLRELPEKRRSMQPMFSSAIRYQYGMDPFHTNPFHCLSGNHRPSGRSHDNRRMESIQEDSCPLDAGAEMGETNPTLSGHTQASKSPENKIATSQSST